MRPSVDIIWTDEAVGVEQQAYAGDAASAGFERMNGDRERNGHAAVATNGAFTMLPDAIAGQSRNGMSVRLSMGSSGENEEGRHGTDAKSANGADSPLETRDGDLDERERMRRERIGKANHGRVPWNKGKTHTDETRAKISAATKAAMSRPDVKAKLKQNVRRSQSAEIRKKISLALRARFEASSSERNSALREGLREVKIKIASGPPPVSEPRDAMDDDLVDDDDDDAAKKRAPKDPREPQNGRVMSVQHRERIRDAIAKKWQTPEYREKIIAGMRNRKGVSSSSSSSRPRGEPTAASLYEPFTTRLPASRNRSSSSSRVRSVDPEKEAARKARAAARRAEQRQNAGTRPVDHAEVAILADIRAELERKARQLILDAQMMAANLEASGVRDEDSHRALASAKAMLMAAKGALRDPQGAKGN
eukprot:jgi/Mesvir1/27473/Mv07248-RA.1